MPFDIKNNPTNSDNLLHFEFLNLAIMDTNIVIKISLLTLFLRMVLFFSRTFVIIAHKIGACSEICFAMSPKLNVIQEEVAGKVPKFLLRASNSSSIQF